MPSSQHCSEESYEAQTLSTRLPGTRKKPWKKIHFFEDAADRRHDLRVFSCHRNPRIYPGPIDPMNVTLRCWRFSRIRCEMGGGSLIDPRHSSRSHFRRHVQNENTGLRTIKDRISPVRSRHWTKGSPAKRHTLDKTWSWSSTKKKYEICLPCVGVWEKLHCFLFRCEDGLGLLTAGARPERRRETPRSMSRAIPAPIPEWSCSHTPTDGVGGSGVSHQITRLKYAPVLVILQKPCRGYETSDWHILLPIFRRLSPLREGFTHILRRSMPRSQQRSKESCIAQTSKKSWKRKLKKANQFLWGRQTAWKEIDIPRPKTTEPRQEHQPIKEAMETHNLVIEKKGDCNLWTARRKCSNGDSCSVKYGMGKKGKRQRRAWKNPFSLSWTSITQS